jgi:hypothetical protein
MSRDALRDRLRLAAAEVPYREEEVLAPDEFESQARRNQLEALRVFDPEASLYEELTVRLVTAQLQSGGLTAEAATILKPLQETVGALSAEAFDLEITGISRGSTILHVRAKVRPEESLDGMPIDASRADAPMRALVGLLRAAEAEQDIRRWRAGAHSAARFADALDKLEADLDLTWWAVDGRVSSASVSSRGRTYLRRMQDTSESVSRRIVSGRVTELREQGHVKVKTGVQRNSAAFDVHVDPDELATMRLFLGDSVHFVVDEVVFLDRLGQAQRTEFRFVSQA